MHKEDIIEIFQILKSNMSLYLNWEERLNAMITAKEWKATIRSRSEDLSKSYQDVYYFFEKRITAILQHKILLDDEAYAQFFQCTYEFYLSSEDPFLLKRLALFLLPYYEERQDDDHRILLYLCLGYSYLEISRVHKEPAGQLSVMYYQKITAYQDRLSSFTDERVKTAIFIAFNNLLRVEPSLQNISIQDAYDYYLQLQKIQQTLTFSPKEEATSRIPELNHSAMDSFVSRALESILSKDEMEKELRHALEDLILKKYQQLTTKEDLLKEPDFIMNYWLWMGDKGEISYSEIYFMMERFFESDVLNNLANATEIIEYLANPINILLKCLEKADFDHAFKEEMDHRYCAEILSFMKKYPRDVTSYALTTSLKEFALHPAVFKYMTTAEEKDDFIFNLFISRQFTTCLHSFMVSVMAKIIISEIITDMPEQLIGICDCQTVEDVQQNAEEIISYATWAGLLHDIGKTGMIQIISTEYRSLSGEEFEIIRLHPEIGYQCLSVDPHFDKYRDIALGHHKYYDGSKGYPTSFDHRTSPYRIVIDLIAVCDSLDAMTDNFGRNYHRALTFHEALSDLEKEKGTRYHPAIVSLIRKQNVFKRLQNITGKEREKIYQNIHESMFYQSES